MKLRLGLDPELLREPTLLILDEPKNGTRLSTVAFGGTDSAGYAHTLIITAFDAAAVICVRIFRTRDVASRSMRAREPARYTATLAESPPLLWTASVSDRAPAKLPQSVRARAAVSG
jgi:hypothetical protein